MPPRRIDLLTEISGVPFDEAWSSLGFGLSMTSKLRDVRVVDPTTNEVSIDKDLSTLRWGGFLALDLTLFPF